MNNSKKRILFISPFFFPEPISTGKFNTNLAEELVKKGHKVKVLCFHPFYPSWKIEKTNKELENIEIIRGGKNIKFSNKAFLRRLQLEFSFMLFVIIRFRKTIRNVDVIVPVFPPSLAYFMISVFLPKKLIKVGMIHDLQEIYSKNKKGYLHKILRYFIHFTEKRCFNSCDKLVFLSNEMKEEAKKMYQLKNNLVVQYPFFSMSEEVTNDLSHIFEESKINIVYSGSLGEKQNPKELYNFFDFASRKLENTSFFFFSTGDVFTNLKSKNKNNSIKFHDLVPKKNLKELYNKSSVQIIPQLPNTSKGSLPSKLPNLINTGCKTLLITDKNSEIEYLFKKYNLGKVVLNWNFNEILDALQTLLDNDIDKKEQFITSKKLFTLDSMISKILN